MAIWEYKVISSGKGGFATPQLLENFLNQLGKDEWEIIDYRPAPENLLAFTGLARRGTQRDWTLEAAAAAQAKADEERRRAEERAEKAAREAAAERDAARSSRDGSGGDADDDEALSQRDSSLRTLRDTERDDDPEALAEEAAAADDLADWEDLELDDDLPTLFDAVKPHLRRNQKGPGEAAALDYLARRWDQEPSDVLGALQECGLVVPETEDDLPEYFEFEGDLFWLNRNNRGQIFLNVREKPRARFKPTPMRKLEADDPATEELRAEHDAEQEKKKQARDAQEAREAEKAARQAAAAAEAAKPPPPLPAGDALLDKLKPKMRRNRRGPGMSGTIAFLAKALKHTEDELLQALEAIGLKASDDDNEKPAFLEAGGQLYWLKKDKRGGVWINCRDKDKGGKGNKPAVPNAETETSEVGDGEQSGDVASSAAADADSDAVGDAEDAGVDADADGADSDSDSENANDSNEAEATDDAADDADEIAVTFEPGPKALPALRLLLKPKARGNGAAAEISTLARKLGKPAVEILESLVKAGLNVPDNADEKPTFVELGDEILWLNRNAKDESLWLNAKAKPKRGGRSRPARKKASAKPTADDAAAEE